jgi:hypothetical protein
MKINLWLKGAKSTIYVGGDPDKNEPPVITLEIKDPQILIEPDKYLIKILETK